MYRLSFLFLSLNMIKINVVLPLKGKKNYRFPLRSLVSETKAAVKACSAQKKKKIMDIAVKTHFLGCNPKIVRRSHHKEVFTKLNCSKLCVSTLQIRHGQFSGRLYTRRSHKCFPTISAVLSGAKDVEVSSSEFDGFSVSTSSGISEPGELKISVEVSGTITQKVFDEVFEKMVADAQPIPGFRRVKGGKTPNIPKDILLEILGPSKVFKQVIKNVINSTVAEYVGKEGLKVSKDLRVEQSFEDLESTFETGETFNFDAILQIQEMK